MADDNELLGRRREARLALGGEKLAAHEATVTKRRREAMLAMESEKHRERRVTREMISSRAALAAKAAAETASRTATEAQTKAARAEAERARAEEMALSGEVERRDKILRAAKTVSQLKGTETKLSALRTIKTDMARAVKEGGLSLSKIAAMSSERGHLKPPVTAPRSNNTIVVLSLILVIAASGGLAFWWWQTQGLPIIPVPIVVKPPTEQSIFRTDNVRALDAATFHSPTEARAALETTATKISAEPAGLVNIYLERAKVTLTFHNFITTLGLIIPDELTRYLRDSFVFGVYDEGQDQPRFLLLQTSFLDQAWTAMANWERYLPNDLAFLLKTDPPRLATWTDQVVRNKSVRVAKDPSGKIVLLYGSLDDQNILIARNEATFIKVFERLIDQS